MTRIKVCGLKRREDIGYVNETLPDYCGFIVEFPKSSRCVSREKARELSAMLDDRIVPVGVFVNAPVQLPAELLKEGVIGAAQLHGDEDESYISRLREMTEDMGPEDGRASEVRIIKAFSVRSADDVDRAVSSSADMILLDQGSGGTGRKFDWELAGNAARPFFLAGGLGPENLGEALEELDPWAVDMSSGLETEGVKDREKIREAVTIVRDHNRRNI